jgi:hypothetical protein
MATGLIDFTKLTPYSGYLRSTVNAGEFMQCSEGHNGITLTRSYEPGKGHYVRGWCWQCKKGQTVYDHERGTR